MSRNVDYDLSCLKNYLINNSVNEEIILSLNEIENIVGGKLPDFSYKKPGQYRFWYNDYNNNPTYAPYWLDVGYKARYDINNSVVIFTKAIIEKKSIKNKKSSSKVYLSDLDIDTAIYAVKKYHYSIDSNYTRYKSWEHCYNAFKIYRHDKNKVEFLCLHLSCYLASWGMLRNSALINYDYLIHKEFVERIADTQYDKLYVENFRDISLVKKIVNIINGTYPNTISKTDTFTTKILLGVFGCTPAYDRYFKKAVTTYNVSSGNFNEKSLIDLYSYYEMYFDEFEKLRNQLFEEGVYYTPMKMIDMCFWQLGFDMENK